MIFFYSPTLNKYNLRFSYNEESFNKKKLKELALLLRKEVYCANISISCNECPLHTIEKINGISCLAVIISKFEKIEKEGKKYIEMKKTLIDDFFKYVLKEVFIQEELEI